jgi:GNAT superfamily N-acetyltransferase
VDKEEVLRFCVDTFEWGDYIDQVWDVWYSDPNGILLVTENDKKCDIQCKKSSPTIAVSHASLCPNNKNLWLEGIRVHPDFRRRSIATQLLNKMISYGKKQGAKEAAAIVANNNFASQLMMESNGFVVISKWNYYSINKIPKIVDKTKLGSKVASSGDTEIIRNYLRRSEVYNLSGKRYVNSWRWYSLDLHSNILEDFIKHEKILVIGNDPIEGLAIIDKDNNNNTFQIVYLDASNTNVLEDLIRFVIYLVRSEGAIYDRVQVYSAQTAYISTVMERQGSERSAEFLLFKRDL